MHAFLCEWKSEANNCNAGFSVYLARVFGIGANVISEKEWARRDMEWKRRDLRQLYILGIRLIIIMVQQQFSVKEKLSRQTWLYSVLGLSLHITVTNYEKQQNKPLATDQHILRHRTSVQRQWHSIQFTDLQTTGGKTWLFMSRHLST